MSHTYRYLLDQDVSARSRDTPVEQITVRSSSARLILLDGPGLRLAALALVVRVSVSGMSAVGKPATPHGPMTQASDAGHRVRTVSAALGGPERLPPPFVVPPGVRSCCARPGSRAIGPGLSISESKRFDGYPQNRVHSGTALA
jgi:hypothetical protein